MYVLQYFHNPNPSYLNINPKKVVSVISVMLSREITNNVADHGPQAIIKRRDN